MILKLLDGRSQLCALPPGGGAALRAPLRHPCGGGSPPTRCQNGHPPQAPTRPACSDEPPRALGKWFGAYAARLQRAGFDAPTWHQLIETTRPEEPAVHNFGDPLRGWQRAATASLDAAACESLLSDLDPALRTLLLSQAGLGG